MLSILVMMNLTACGLFNTTSSADKTESISLLKDLIPRSISLYGSLHNPPDEQPVSSIENGDNYCYQTYVGGILGAHSIKEIKKLIEEIYTVECAEKNMYGSLFEGKDNHPPFFIEKNGTLYQLDTAVGYITDWLYDTTEILERNDTFIKVKVKTEFGDEISFETIELKKENGTWKLNTYIFSV